MVIAKRAQDNIFANSSARGVFWNMDMLYSMAWKILGKNIHFHSYKISRAQELFYVDNDKWFAFVPTFLTSMEVDENQEWKILWGDQAHFYLNESVNAQKCPGAMKIENHRIQSKKFL